MARKPRDFDAELQALMERAKKPKGQKTTQLGELVQVTGADALPIEALAGVQLAAIEQSRKRLAPAMLLRELWATWAGLRRLAQARARLDTARARTDQRTWMQARRERTRHLVELGSLVQKAGFVELADDRATLLGAFLMLADLPRQGERMGVGVGAGAGGVADIGGARARQ